MASILRTGKFLRYFAGITRNVVVNTTAPAPESNNLLLQHSACMCNPFQQSFASQAAPRTDVSLERHLRRLDQDARRVGRISRHDIEDALEEIRSHRSPTSSQSLLVIRCCGNLVPEETPEVRTALVQEIWKTLNALNVPMDISHYNALLRVYLENEHPFSPTDFLAELEAKSIEPNRVTYQRLIARYCQQGDIDGATRILEFMREKNLPVNENVFNSLIVGHAQANDMESAKGIISVMKQSGLEPTAETYTTLLCCYARQGDIETIVRQLEECEGKEVFLLDKDLLDIVYALTVNGHGDKIDPVLSKLHKSTGFNQDAVNVILRLVNKGHEDIGLKILRLMPRTARADGQPVDAGSFFIRQLVKANRPIEKILSICKTLQDEGLNTKALLIATESGLQKGLLNNALPLLTEMKNAGLPVRQHYFWPLICSAEPNRVLDIVRRMQEEFSLNPNSETVRDYVIPNLREKNWDKVVQLLRGAGVSNNIAASSAASSALGSFKLKEAATIMESYRAYYAPTLFRQLLIQALSQTKDFDSFIRVVRQIYEGVLYRQSRNSSVKSAQNEEESEVAEDAAEVIEGDGNQVPDVVGSIVLDAFTYFRRDRVAIMEKILRGLVKEGLSISSSRTLLLSERLGAELTPEISQLLGKLSSGELEPRPLKNSPAKKRTPDDMTVEELERFIANVESKGEGNANNLKRHLLNACYKSKNLTKFQQVMEKLEQEKFVIPSGAFAQMIDLYAHHGKTSEALALYDELKQKTPEFKLDNLKTLNVVELLLKEERFEEALKFLDANKKAEPFAEGDGNFNYVSTVWRLLNSLAEAGNDKRLSVLFDVLMVGNYMQPTNVLLGPLIKVHLVQENIEKAMAAFEEICEKYKATPWKNEIARRLIEKEDAVNLQRLTDLSTNIHGEVNSLYDLVFSFVECGRIRQARKILETPGLRTRPQRIETACERYKNEGMVQPLEGLIEATKDLSHIDRNKIYYNLLLSYTSSNDAEKALGLWTKMQEENITPSDAFLIKLAELLKKNKMEVPFVVPLTQQEVNKKQPKQAGKAAKNANVEQVAAAPKKETPTNLALFRKAIRSDDVDAALVYRSQFSPSEKESPLDTSHLIELLVRSERLSEATKLVKEMLSKNQHPLPKIFKFYLNKLAGSGDLNTMAEIGTKLSEEMKKTVSYDNRFCHANIVAGKGEQYLKSLMDEILACKSEEEAAKLAERFPRGGALGILGNHPEMVPQFEKLAEKYAEFKQLGPVNVLWMHYTSEGNEANSKAIWDKYLSNAPRLMFQRVLQTAREQKDDKIAQTVINQLRGSKISEGAIGNAYSCLIDIQTLQDQPEKALDTLKTAIKDVCLENINRTALQRLKAALEAKNKEFPYTIPNYNKNKAKDGGHSSSSSQSSDDDVTPKRPETIPSKPTQ